MNKKRPMYAIFISHVSSGKECP